MSLQTLARSKLAGIIKRRDDYKCIYCGSPHNLTYDHIVPISRGGFTRPDNVVTACFYCNQLRGNLSLRKWVALVAEEQGINPQLLALKIHVRLYFRPDWNQGPLPKRARAQGPRRSLAQRRKKIREIMERKQGIPKKKRGIR